MAEVWEAAIKEMPETKIRITKEDKYRYTIKWVDPRINLVDVFEGFAPGIRPAVEMVNETARMLEMTVIWNPPLPNVTMLKLLDQTFDSFKEIHGKLPKEITVHPRVVEDLKEIKKVIGAWELKEEPEFLIYKGVRIHSDPHEPFISWS